MKRISGGTRGNLLVGLLQVPQLCIHPGKSERVHHANACLDRVVSMRLEMSVEVEDVLQINVLH